MELDTNSKLIRYIEENGITSVLNNTKWERLFKELIEIDWTLDYKRKDLDEAEPNSNSWESGAYHIMGKWQKIEWLDIRALVSESRGALLQPKITNNIDLLIESLRRAGTPYSLHQDGVRIWGYVRPGVNPKWE